MRDTLGWGGRKSSPAIFVTSDHVKAEPNWPRSVDSTTAKIAVRNDNLGMSLIRDSVTELGRFPISTANETLWIICKAFPCTTFACGTFWRRNPMRVYDGHPTVSVVRGDDRMLVTPYLRFFIGSNSPTFEFRSDQAPKMFTRYARHFENTWNLAED